MNLLDSLRYLAALEQHRHFGRAAQACHITQPALSNAIRALEAEFGVTIVRRGRQYEGLTPEGELALAHAHRLLHEAEALRQALASAAGTPTGRLKIGAVPTAVPVATLFATRLAAQHPGIEPELRTLSSPDIEAGLDDLSLDLALGFSARAEVAQRRLGVCPQYDEACYVLQRAARDDAPFELGPPLGWAEAAGLPLALLTPEMHHRAVVDGAFRAAGVSPRPALQTDAVLALLIAVRDGALSAVLPGAVVATVRGQPGLVARPLASPEVTTPVGFLYNAGSRHGQALQAALALAGSAGWLSGLAARSGLLGLPADAPDTATGITR